MGVHRLGGTGQTIIQRAVRETLPSLAHHIAGEPVRALELRLSSRTEFADAREEKSVVSLAQFEEKVQRHMADNVHVIRNIPHEADTSSGRLKEN